MNSKDLLKSVFVNCVYHIKMWNKHTSDEYDIFVIYCESMHSNKLQESISHFHHPLEFISWVLTLKLEILSYSWQWETKWIHLKTISSSCLNNDLVPFFSVFVSWDLEVKTLGGLHSKLHCSSKFKINFNMKLSLCSLLALRDPSSFGCNCHPEWHSFSLLLSVSLNSFLHGHTFYNFQCNLCVQ